MLTRKDYAALANLISKGTADGLSYDKVIPKLPFLLALSDWLAQDNPRFDRKRFIAACNKPESPLW